ncbi:uncharacterized protein LOC107655941 [Sinocyclocheilus anshuiensis]|uniref:uncharacterized protein LOC107655941 n=1 Tax=Sinocyclocheilus anshuiensis TaxID=1608454 RepID=UPI0007BA80D8|nr:PREDICTED: uncharacterized protein LOC107655941 [Sinocyclocheilus anshuiensis]
MDAIKPPGSLKLCGNVDANWRTFKQQFTLYVSAIGQAEAADERKIAMLLTIAGVDAVEVYNTFNFEDEADQKKLDKVLEKVDAHCLSKKNETYERYVFRTRMQHEGEAFDCFLTDLKIKTKTCHFNELRDSMIRDQIVFGICDKTVRERLLRESELTLDHAVELCQSSELARQQVMQFDVSSATSSPNAAAAIDAIFFRDKKREITFLGNKLSAKGVEPNPAKVQALLEMPPPNDKKGVLRA